MELQVSPPAISGPLTFKVHRRKPELVSPAKPTPRELKLLSDIDDQQGLRFHIPTIFFYRHNPKAYSDPVTVIRRSLSETLVYFYPFAGRLREGPNRKLAVDCTGEGVLFIEADADVALVEFEQKDALQPPFPGFKDLLFEVEGSSEMLNTPLILMQVTRLNCGGFVFAIRINHVLSDAAGLSLFLKAMSDFACGSHAPKVVPVWERHLLSARVPGRVTFSHHEYDESESAKEEDSGCGGNTLVGRSFFFGGAEMSTIRGLLQPELVNRSTDVEILTSILWRCRTAALKPDPNKEVRLIFIVNARPKLKSPPLPPGYYGNAFAFPVAIATARKLIEKPFEFALGLIKEVKSSVTEEYMRSLVDLMVTKGRPRFSTDGAFLISDVRNFAKFDFGTWGKPVYGGIGTAGVSGFAAASFYVSFENKEGETGIVVPVCLPEKAMQRFVEELNGVFNGQSESNGGNNSPNCAKPDPEVDEDTEKNYAELLTEELKLHEVEALEKHKRAYVGLLEAKKVNSSFKKEADKCNSGIETCEEAREKAELALAEQKKLTSKWEERTRQKGWKERVTKSHVKPKSNVQVA